MHSDPVALWVLGFSIVVVVLAWCIDVLGGGLQR